MFLSEESRAPWTATSQEDKRARRPNLADAAKAARQKQTRYNREFGEAMREAAQYNAGGICGLVPMRRIIVWLVETCYPECWIACGADAASKLGQQTSLSGLAKTLGGSQSRVEGKPIQPEAVAVKVLMFGR